MSDSPLRLPSLNRWREGDEPSANHFNEGLDAIEDLKRGIDPPSPSNNAPRFTALPKRVRYLITDSTLQLQTNIVGGTTYEVGQLVLRATSTNADGRDGVYLTSYSVWPVVGWLAVNNLEPRAPVYPHGEIISVWGSGTIRLFGTTFSGALTF